jgi:hypoxanthine phosphoribosyltransferase
MTDTRTTKLSWSDIDALCGRLAEQLRARSPDYVLGIARGGLIPATRLAYLLAIPRFGMLQLRSYPVDGTPAIGASTALSVISSTDLTAVRGRRVVVVDDVVDSGLTLATASRMLQQYDPDLLIPTTLLSFTRRRLHAAPSLLFVRQIDHWHAFPWESHP